MCEHKGCNEKFAWKPFLRQLVVVSGPWMIYFMLGLCSGAPTVFIPQLRREANSTDAVSDDMASWLTSVISYSGILWTLMLPILVTFVGRKISHAIVCFTALVGFVVIYCSSNVYEILIGEILEGAIAGSFLTVSLITITEYTSTKYRGVFLTIKSATFFWGVLVSNAIGTFFHWKNITVVALLCSSYSMLTVVFWPESPVWLATQKRFDECADSHRCLKGSDKDSEKELHSLIAKYENTDIKSMTLKNHLTDIIQTVCCKHFYKPIMYSLPLLLLYVFSGKTICTVYAIDILTKITKSDSTAYSGMLILDGVTVLSMYVGCFITKLINRRTLLLVSSSIGVAFLFAISLYLYLVKELVIIDNKYVSILLLVGFSVAISCGPMILSTSIAGELIPLESRCLSMCAIAVIIHTVQGTFIKQVPFSFKLLGLHGTFFLFGTLSSVCLVLIYLYLPETKDKTVEEIANFLRGTTLLEEVDVLIPINNNIVIVPRK